MFLRKFFCDMMDSKKAVVKEDSVTKEFVQNEIEVAISKLREELRAEFQKILDDRFVTEQQKSLTVDEICLELIRRDKEQQEERKRKMEEEHEIAMRERQIELQRIREKEEREDNEVIASKNLEQHPDPTLQRLRVYIPAGSIRVIAHDNSCWFTRDTPTSPWISPNNFPNPMGTTQSQFISKFCCRLNERVYTFDKTYLAMMIAFPAISDQEIEAEIVEVSKSNNVLKYDPYTFFNPAERPPTPDFSKQFSPIVNYSSNDGQSSNSISESECSSVEDETDSSNVSNTSDEREQNEPVGL